MQSVLVLSKSMFCTYFSNNSGLAILSSKTERPVWVCTAPDNWQLVIIAEGFSKDSSKLGEKTIFWLLQPAIYSVQKECYMFRVENK